MKTPRVLYPGLAPEESVEMRLQSSEVTKALRASSCRLKEVVLERPSNARMMGGGWVLEPPQLAEADETEADEVLLHPHLP